MDKSFGETLHKRRYANGQKQMKRCKHHQSSEESKLNTQLGDITTPLLDELKFKRLAIPSIDKDFEQPELLLTDGGNVKWYNHFGKQFSSFIKH